MYFLLSLLLAAVLALCISTTADAQDLSNPACKCSEVNRCQENANAGGCQSFWTLSFCYVADGPSCPEALPSQSCTSAVTGEPLYYIYWNDQTCPASAFDPVTTEPPTTTEAPPTPPPTTTEAPTTVPPTTEEPVTQPPGSSTCGSSRVRKSWSSLTSSERSLYLNAVATSMDRGLYIYFNEIHMEQLSAAEAHNTCGFLYWHRRFLLAFENMLRSLSPEFACVTVPYWDYFEDYQRLVDGECSNLLNCSPILQDFGGSDSTTGFRSVVINGQRFNTFNCVNSDPVASHFCQSSASTTNCANCIPRGDWGQTNFPSGFGYASLMRALEEPSSFQGISNNIEGRTHNSMHSAMGSVMASYASPSEPIFFSHHATVDLLHYIYYKCFVGKLSIQEKQSSNLAYESCGNSPGHGGTFEMNWERANENSFTPVEDHPVIGQYFNAAPELYYEYADTEELGSRNSYSYELDDLLSELLDDGNGMACPNFDPSSRKLRSKKGRRKRGDLKRKWHTKAKNVLSGIGVNNKKDVLIQLELVECLRHQEKFGGVEDYTTEFREQMKFLPSNAHTPCMELFIQLLNGKVHLEVNDWKDLIS